MNRLTEKRKKTLLTGNEEVIEYRLVRSYDSCINKLGKLEDLMEKYEIENLEALEEIIKDYDNMAKDIVEMGIGVKIDFKDSE